MLKNLTELGIRVFALDPQFEYRETGKFPFRRKPDTSPEMKVVNSQVHHQEPFVPRNSCTETQDIPDRNLAPGFVGILVIVRS